jgi:endonuclease YncB( thermonuclease family)
MRARKAFWPVVLMIMAAGFFARGRSNTAVNPTFHVASPSAAEVPSNTTPKASVHTPPPVAKTELQKIPPARHRDGRKVQLRLSVVGVHDGDTLTGVDEDRGQHKIRLDAIDAPELGQPFGQTAKKALSGKVFGKEVIVIPKTTDRYGRTVGHVLIDGRDVNLEMLEEGMAWHYEKYDHNRRLREAEQESRKSGRGLWQDSAPQAPWDWRKQERTQRGSR